ncbi:MAG: hypothetical protein J5998_03800 [Clostridia bacterium]|nr:hypothetical protein [Clostridia bacterium]
MRKRMVRVRRRPPAKRMAALFALTLAAFLYMTLRRGDPVEAILSARDAERVRTDVVFEGIELHAVRTAACNSQETARVEAARYAPRGAAGYVLRRETWHVLCAGYETAGDAAAVRDRLREEEGMACDTVSLVCGSVRLRVTATAEQTAALVACEKKLRETVALIGALSYSLDGGDTAVPQLLGVLRSQREALSAARVRFLETAGGGEGLDDAVCRPLIDIAEAAEKGLDTLTGEASSLSQTLFSGRMKALFLALRVRQIEYLASLGG